MGVILFITVTLHLLKLMFSFLLFDIQRFLFALLSIFHDAISIRFDDYVFRLFENRADDVISISFAYLSFVSTNPTSGFAAICD